jgi:hypothetical protein
MAIILEGVGGTVIRIREEAARVLRTLGRHKTSTPEPVTHKWARLHEELNLLLETRDVISIVQVGANDGRINDPISPFVTANPLRTRLLLIEPQEQLLPMLRETYADHRSATIVQCAIGPMGETTLWQVDQQCWKDFRPYYAVASDWPDYRAASGITSESRDRVERLIAKNYSGTLPLDDVLTSFVMKSLPLVDVLESSGFGFGVDLLQVDTEGSDDVVIMNCSIEQLRPALINFEIAHLSENRLEAIFSHLRTNGYEISDNGFDALAVLDAA